MSLRIDEHVRRCRFSECRAALRRRADEQASHFRQRQTCGTECDKGYRRELNQRLTAARLAKLSYAPPHQVSRWDGKTEVLQWFLCAHPAPDERLFPMSGDNWRMTNK